jgi:hypothetical protein
VLYPAELPGDCQFALFLLGLCSTLHRPPEEGTKGLRFFAFFEEGVKVFGRAMAEDEGDLLEGSGAEVFGLPVPNGYPSLELSEKFVALGFYQSRRSFFEDCSLFENVCY